ncbi:MAG: helix-turn-helix transcriptional regulator [Bdellovibrionales bacterium]|nr:helix-turn-helix transcriptional regulator [Bdellovibrionales bacterium]
MMKNVGQYVRQKRKKVGLTQVELAKSAGVGLRFVRELEGGKETLRCDTVNQVLALFGTRLGPVPKVNEADEL